MEIGFSNPHYLWLLVPIPIFFVVMLTFLIRGKEDIGRFISFHALEFLYKKDGFVIRYLKKNFLVFMLRVMIYVIVVFVIAGTTVYYNGIAKQKAIVIAIDASGSMLAEDIQPNRLEAVKETIGAFLEKTAPKSEIAILSFSGNAYIEQELSSEEESKKPELVLLISEKGESVIAEQELDKIVESIRILKNIQISPISGTCIGTALRTAANILNKEKKPKLVLLISDGGENIIAEEELNKIVNSVNREHITVDIIGIGKIEGAKLPGVELESTLNEPLLEDIAKKTNGMYLRAETKQSLTEAYEKIALSTKLKIPIMLASPLVVMLCIILLSVDYAFVRLI